MGHVGAKPQAPCNERSPKHSIEIEMGPGLVLFPILRSAATKLLFHTKYRTFVEHDSQEKSLKNLAFSM